MRDGVQVGLLVHAHAEGGVEYSYVRFARANFFTGLDTHQVGRVVQRARVEALADSSLDILVDNDGFGKLGAAVEHAVADCIDLIDRFDDAVFCAGQSVQNQLYSYGVVRHWGLNNIVVFARYFVGQDRTVDADSLAETLGQDLLVLHINQLIFQRGASAVQNKNFHFKFLHHFLKPPAREAGQRRIDTPIHLLYYYI